MQWQIRKHCVSHGATNLAWALEQLHVAEAGVTKRWEDFVHEGSSSTCGLDQPISGSVRWHVLNSQVARLEQSGGHVLNSQVGMP